MMRVCPEEYLRTSYSPEMEYVDGQLVDRHVGDYIHSWFHAMTIGLVGGRSDERHFSAFASQRVRVSDEPRYRVPDVCIKALPHEIIPVIEKPDLVIEIVSPEDSATDMLEKVGDYQAAGIRHIWIVDPYRRKLTVIDGPRIRNAPDLIAETELIGRVDFAPLFSKLDRAGQSNVI